MRKFEEGYYPWARCFNKISFDTAEMDPEEDLYDPPKQQVNRLWVNGPNRQFEKGLRTAQFPKFEEFGYQLAYLMEPDSVPLQRFWLDRLRKEIEERRPFAVLGRYTCSKHSNRLFPVSNLNLEFDVCIVVLNQKIANIAATIGTISIATCPFLS